MLSIPLRTTIPNDKQLCLYDMYMESMEILRKEGYNAVGHTYVVGDTIITPDSKFVPDRVVMYDSNDHWAVDGFGIYAKETGYMNLELNLGLN